MTEQRTERRTLDSDDSGSGYVVVRSDDWERISGIAENDDVRCLEGIEAIPVTYNETWVGNRCHDGWIA